MNCKEIIKTYLVQHGYDGLYAEDCGCFLSDLFPCGECFENCRPGIKSAIGNCYWKDPGCPVQGIGPKSFPFEKYRNPDKRCQYPFGSGSLGYCCSYACHIDGKDERYKDITVICRKCKLWVDKKQDPDDFEFSYFRFPPKPEQQLPTIEEMSGSIYENGPYLAQSLNDKAFAYKGLHGWSVVFDDNSGELGMSDERFFKQRGFRIIRKIEMGEGKNNLTVWEDLPSMAIESRRWLLSNVYLNMPILRRKSPGSAGI
jgi:hypothetical protein